jgi:hypothetical protein
MKKSANAIRTLSAGLSVFRIGDGWRLAFVRQYDVDVGDSSMFGGARSPGRDSIPMTTG